MPNDRCPVTFVNAVAVTGFANGVVNVAMSTFGYTPEVQGDKTVVASDIHVTANLRMDLFCAQQLRDHLDQIIQEHTKPTAEKVN